MTMNISPKKPHSSTKIPLSPEHPKQAGRTGTPVTGMSAEGFATEASEDATRGGGTVGSTGDVIVGEQLEAELGKDREVLREHAAALKRLEELQKDMIGGEKAGTYVFLMYMYINVRVHNYIPYSGKFWLGFIFVIFVTESPKTKK